MSARYLLYRFLNVEKTNNGTFQNPSDLMSLLFSIKAALYVGSGRSLLSCCKDKYQNESNSKIFWNIFDTFRRQISLLFKYIC